MLRQAWGIGVESKRLFSKIMIGMIGIENAMAERNVQDIVHASRKLLERAGMPACMWPYAAPCYCFNHNTEIVKDKVDSSTSKGKEL